MASDTVLNDALSHLTLFFFQVIFSSTDDIRLHTTLSKEQSPGISVKSMNRQ